MSIEAWIALFEIFIMIILLIIVCLVIVYIYIGKQKNKPKEEDVIFSDTSTDKNDKKSQIGRFKDVLTQESVLDFMEFDEVIDNMIIRKDKTQYLMVLACNGVNYDLLSEVEKIGVEEGFIQFLNTLRFPVQLYVQSRTLNLKDIIENYKVRVVTVEEEVEKLNLKIKQALNSGNRALREKLEFERRRKLNILDYGKNIVEYVEKMSLNKNILQQKTYVVIPFWSLELGGSLDNFSKEEINGMCFSELYTRAQNISSALASSGVSSRILNSEELSELLYVAYNRDESELYQFSKALDAQYDALYSSGKDVLEKKQEMINEQLDLEAVDLASNSILYADRRRKEEEFRATLENQEIIKQKALNLVQEYQDQLDSQVYDYAVEEIEKFGVNKTSTNDETPVKRKVIKRKPREE